MRLADLTVWLSRTAGVSQFRSYRVRILVQSYFALISILLGIQFARFVHAAESGIVPLPHRPPGVEGYLPISGLMGAIDWVYQGTLNTVHPAATTLILLFIGMSLIFRRSFCSWICPVGLLSESLARLGQKIFRKNARVPRWLDIPFRGLRYLLLGFFLVAILSMSPAELRGFIESPYNQVSDVKMYLFFVEIGKVGLISIGLLVMGSVFINGFWCRYLCPYGALVGFSALLSPFRIRRNTDTCIDCGLCDKVCMANLPVATKESLKGVECTGCMDCVAVCPVPETLLMRTKKRGLGIAGYALGVVLLFTAGYVGGRVAGMWESDMSDRDYIEHISRIDDPSYGHPGQR
ncbi:4Fe-4S binding protein [Gemmatimonadota bacterium]